MRSRNPERCVRARGAGKAALVALAAAACDGRAPDPALPAGFDRYFVRETPLRLEETPEVVTVLPFARPDARGGFLVADPREAQVRRYADDGSLLAHFGTRGTGPGEFQAPFHAARLPDGGIVVGELDGRLRFFGADGPPEVRSERAPVRALTAVHPLPDGTLLLVSGGAADPARPHLLTRWDPADGSARGFFARPPLRNAAEEAVAAASGHASAALRADTIAATYAFDPRIHLFAGDGRPLGTVPIALERYDALRVDAASGDPRELSRILERVTLVRDVHWLPDGRFLVQTSRATGPFTETYGLLLLSRDGRRIAKLDGTPRLVMLTADGRLVFEDPDGEPGAWFYARPRS